jgi:hypothetical protein
MLVENDQRLEDISSEQKLLANEITVNSKDIENLRDVLAENKNRADQEVYGKATNVNEKVNRMMQQHLLHEDEDLQSINTHEDFLDKIKTTADKIRMKPPKMVKEPLSKEEKEEEKKEIEIVNQAEDQFADQLTNLLEIGFTDLKANISALTEANGDMDRAIDLLIIESRKPVSFQISREPEPVHSLTEMPSSSLISERFILDRTRAL